MNASSNELIGKTVQGYQLKQLLGGGGFGEVYLAYQAVVNRQVAIKVIHSHFIDKPEFIRRFEAEAHIIARLEHLHIVPIYDFWRDPEGAYLVMRWLSGGSLRSKMALGPISLPMISKVLQQITAAIALAHRNNIIHCDIKPDNVLMDSEGNAYLSDFGIAQIPTSMIEEDEHDSFGSPFYMSPEAILGQMVSPQSDIYSLGIMLFELLTGQLPFEGESLNQVFHHHLSSPVPSIYLLRQDLPPQIDAVIWRATAKPPAARHQNVLQLMQHYLEIMADVNPSGMTVVQTRRPFELGFDTLKLDQSQQIISNPYKGLRFFEESDALDFFGRSALVTELLEHFEGPNGNFVAVVGPSGSGKSSVVRAGVIPALRSGRIDQSQNWFIVTMTPKDQPLVELWNAIRRVAVNNPVTQIDLERGSLDDLTHLIAESLPADQGEIILVIDQFEELFTLVQNEAERVFFLGNLVQALAGTESRFRLIITLRADFYNRPLLYPAFGQLMRKGTVLVLPLLPSELVQAIHEPALRAGLEIEATLLATIVADVREQPGALPLLQYTLTELFEKRKKHTLSLEAYHELGGVIGTLAQRANELYASLPPSQQKLLRQIFLQLVNLGEEPTRRRVLQSDLIALSPDAPAILDLFNQTRLLTFDREVVTRAPTIEIAHEALLNQWQLLKEWIANNREDLQSQRRLGAAAREWQRTHHDPSFLASGARLIQFELLQNKDEIKLTEDERGYLRASLDLRERNSQRLRLFIATLIGLTLLALIFAGFALQQQNSARAESKRANQQTKISRSRELAATSFSNLESQPDLALLLSLEALQTSNTFEARRSLFAALQFQPSIRRFLQGQAAPVRSLALSSDGNLLAANAHDNSIMLWDMETGQSHNLALMAHSARPSALAFSPDGQILASGDTNGSLYFWDMSTGQPLYAALEANLGGIWSLDFSPDGQTLASAGADSAILLWDVATGQAKQRPLMGHDDIIYALRYSPDGKMLASGSGDNTIRLWDATTGNPMGEPLQGHENWVLTLDFNPTGTLLASSGVDTKLILWSIGIGQKLFEFPTSHSNWVRSLAFSADGQSIATGSADHTIRLWDITTGEPLGQTLAAHSDTVWSIVFSPQESLLVSGGEDQKIIVWDTASNLRLGHTITEHSAPINAVAINPDNTLLASVSGGVSSDDNSLRFWEIASSASTVIEYSAPLTSVTFSPDGRFLATGSADSSVILWDVQQHQVVGQTMLGHEDVVWSVAFSDDSKTLASGSEDGHILLWDMETQTRLGSPLESKGSAVHSLVFMGRVLASGDGQGNIYFWDIRTGQQIGDPILAHTNIVTSLAFNPDRRWLASGSRDGTIRLWDATNRQAIGQPLIKHKNWVLGVAFSHDGYWLASAGSDNAVILWDLQTLQPLGDPLIGHIDWVNTVAFAGDKLISGGRDHAVIVWDVGLSPWRQMACQIANRTLTPSEWELYLGLPSAFPKNQAICQAK